MSLFTAGGFIKRLRNPWIRAGAAAFSATTSAIWERDRQVEHRKSLVMLSRDREQRLKAYTAASLGHLNARVMVPDSLMKAGF